MYIFDFWNVLRLKNPLRLKPIYHTDLIPGILFIKSRFKKSIIFMPKDSSRVGVPRINFWGMFLVTSRNEFPSNLVTTNCSAENLFIGANMICIWDEMVKFNCFFFFLYIYCIM